MVDNELTAAVLDLAKAARSAAKKWATATADAKNEALLSIARQLWRDRRDILVANERDLAGAQSAGETATRLDRLRLNEERLKGMMTGLEQVAALPDPVGEVLETFTRPNGIVVSRVRVPFGVIAMVYESRPNVTVDAAALALKTGNTVVLRGGKEAFFSNQALVQSLKKGLAEVGMDPQAVQLVERTERDSVDVLIRARGIVDLVIPRGGAGLIERVVTGATVPVIETGVGNCHMYIDEDADLDMAIDLVVNAKVQRPSVCNAIETVLVHEGLMHWLPTIGRALVDEGVELRACESSYPVLKASGIDEAKLVPATEQDWSEEFLAPVIAVRVVSGVDTAVGHIERYGTRHSEAIVTESHEKAEFFLNNVDAAAVYHNASTRFTDGFEFGFGAEIGISTQKLHARGPMGLREMTTYKYVIHGTGQIRQ